MGKLAMGTEGAIILQRKIQDELLNRGYSSDSDPVMAEYITIMLINDKTPEQINSELSDLIGSDYESNFTEWLFEEAARAANPPVITPLVADEPLTSEAQPRRSSGGANLLHAALSGVHPPTGPALARTGVSTTLGQKRTASARSPSPSSGPNKTRRTDTPTGPRAMMDRPQGQHQNGRSLIERVGHSRRGNFGGHGGLSPAQASHIQAKIDNITANPMSVMNGQPMPMNGAPGMNFSFQDVMMMNMDLMRQMATTMGLPQGGMMPMVPGFGFPQPGIPQPQLGPFGPGPQIFPGPQQGVERGGGPGRGGMTGGRGRGGAPSHASHTQHALAAPSPASAPAHGTIPVGQVPERPSTPSLCKYGLKCTNPQCRYSHPSPVATAESGVVLSTDFCPQGKACKDKDCKMGHVSPSIVNATASRPQPARPPVPPPSSAPASTPTLCRFGSKCTRPNCMFTHPANIRSTAAVQCRFGSGCTRGDCPFQHPPGHVPANMFYRGLSADAPLVEGYVSPHRSVRFGADGKATTATPGKTDKKEEKELEAVGTVDVGA